MRATILVIDSFGIGASPDAREYGDEGSNTAGHICERIPGKKWPELQSLGLGNAARLLGTELSGCEAVAAPLASFGVMRERSPGKDTTTGHWEIAGIVLPRPFRTFPPEYPSFPQELLGAFEREIRRSTIGNRSASGTVIIEELGEEHLRTGKPIVYTSSDSVFQIAAHEEIIGPEELYRFCEIARKLCDSYQVGRVIARPFVGTPGSFRRTSGRRDFSIALPSEGIFDRLRRAGVHTIGIGKIGDIFNEQGIDRSFHDKGNPACLDRVAELLAQTPDPRGEFIFVNLVDTDMVYGHRRDIQGYFDSVAAIDERLRGFAEAMTEGDVLVVTADHGCDPTFRGSDHTREHVPVLFRRKGQRGTSLGVRETFADLAQSLCAIFGAGAMANGRSFVDS